VALAFYGWDALCGVQPTMLTKNYYYCYYYVRLTAFFPGQPG